MIFSFRLLVPLVLALVATQFLFAQGNYQGIYSKGVIPEAIVSSFSENLNSQEAEFEYKQRRRDRKIQEEFLKRSNFVLKYVYRNGDIVFNHDIAEYLNSILDMVLQGQPELRNKVQVFLNKSSSVNAFSTDQGIIFVNVGLVAQATNEAQLAFILCHELIHYLNEHNSESFLERELIKKGRGANRSLSISDRRDRIISYSKDLEIEADLEGLKYYLETDYDIEAVEQVFDILLYSYLPVDELPFRKSFFEDENFKLPDAYELEEVAAISAEEDYDDSFSLHPNIRTRKENIIEAIVDHGGDFGKQHFIVADRSTFQKYQRLARAELSRVYFIDREYGKAIYNAYLNIRDSIYPESNWKIIIKSLHNLGRYKYLGESYDILRNYEDVEGQQQKLIHLLGKLSGEETTVLATKLAWGKYLENPDDGEYKMMAQATLRQLVTDFEARPADFSKKSRRAQLENIDTTKLHDEDLNKYEKIKIQRALDKVAGKEGFLEYAFVGLMDNAEFKAGFDELVEESEEDDDKATKDKSETFVQDKIGYALGIKEMMTLQPVYSSSKQKKAETKYFESEKGEFNMMRYISNISDELGISNEFVSIKNSTRNDIETYNDYCVLMNWVAQYYAHGDENMLFADYNQLNAISDRYGTRYLAWGVARTSKIDDGLGWEHCLGCVIPYLIPFVVYDLIKQDYSTYYHFAVYDIKKNQFVFYSNRVFDSKDAGDYLRSHLYGSLLQVSQEKK